MVATLIALQNSLRRRFDKAQTGSSDVHGQLTKIQSETGSVSAHRWRLPEMITVFGEGRGFRVIWLLEEMGLDYRLRPVELGPNLEEDVEFLAVNPAGFIPAIKDGDITMVESIAIMEYLMARYGPTPLAPEPNDPAFPLFQQFLQLGEAGLAMGAYFVGGARNFAPEAERNSWSARQALDMFESRLRLLKRQLERSPYVAGERFTAADISVIYALELAQAFAGLAVGQAVETYMARARNRHAYERAMDVCVGRRAWLASVRAD